MKTGLGDTLKSRWFAGVIHAGLWLLFVLALMGLAGKWPDFRDSDSNSTGPQSPVPVATLNELFSPGAWPGPMARTNALPPFFTRHFIPPLVPAATTRKFELTYQGFYQSEGGLKQAIVKVGTNFVAATIGGRVVSNLFIWDATLQALTLTNPAAQTNVLPLNAKRELEVPIQ